MILGVGGIVHDSNLALIADGEVLFCGEEERFTRTKHVGGPPRRAWNYTKEHYGLTEDDIEVVAVSRQQYPSFWSDVEAGLQQFLSQFSGANVIRVDHHTAHGYLSYYLSGFSRAGLLTLDGIGDDIGTMSGVCSEGTITPFQRWHHHHSIGMQWIRTCNFLGFPGIFSAGKVMALSAYGVPRYYDVYRQVVHLTTDGYYIKPDPYDLRSVVRCWDDEKPYFLQKALDIPPRGPAEPLRQHHYDIAASLQKITNAVGLHLANCLFSKVRSDNLCLAGGVCLNCPLNSHIIRESKFSNVFIPTGTSDCGDGLGAALACTSHYQGGHEAKDERYLGAHWQNLQKPSLERCVELGPQEIASQLLKGRSIAYVDGRAEFGPRALCHRSILADPSASETHDHISRDVKGREWFRPLGPVVLEDEAQNVFEDPIIDRKMLTISSVKNKWRRKIPAVVHADGTSRPQMLAEEEGSLIYDVVKHFYAETGIPCLINTSLNGPGKPIANSLADAVDTAQERGIDMTIAARNDHGLTFIH